MLSEKCVRVFGGLDMSALGVRAPSATTVLDTMALRVRGVTTLDGVRRNLFGCTDREENRRFVERELARQLELDSQRWGFDFANEKPLPGTQRFAWQLVPASAVPAALRRAPVAVSSPKPPAPAPAPAPAPVIKMSSPDTKTQKRITDFLKPRKRLSNSGKKSPAHAHRLECGHVHGHGAHIRPPKVARLQPHYKRPS